MGTNPRLHAYPPHATLLALPVLHPLRFIAATSCLLVASCIDGNEEYWLRADGSGRAEIRYEIPVSLAASLGGPAGIEGILDAFLTENPDLTDAKRSVTQHADRLTITLEASFESLETLTEALSGEASLTATVGDSSAVEALIGDCTVQRKGLGVVFERTVFPARALPGSRWYPASQLAGRSLTYTLHLPQPARESNATRISDDGRTLVWQHSLAEGAPKELPIRFEASLPVSATLIGGVAGTLGTLTAFGVFAIVRRRRSRTRPGPGTEPGLT